MRVARGCCKIIDTTFPNSSRAQHTDGLCLELFQACKSYANNIIVEILKKGHSVHSLRTGMCTLTEEDFSFACLKLQEISVDKSLIFSSH